VACFSAACFIRNLQRIPGDLSSFELQHALGLVLHDGGGRIDLIPVTPTPHPEGDGAAAAYSARSRTPFRVDAGQHSAVMADTVPR
jgi:hypothetical protein